MGAPQGSSLSPDIFGFHVRDIPQPDWPVQIVSYADDLTIFGTGPLEEICQKINGYLEVLFAYLNSIFLKISPTKSTASLLTRESRQIHRLKSPDQQELQIFIDGKLIPVELHPKILGVTLDPTLVFHKHVADISRRMRNNTNVLKMLASTSFGQSKESLLATYKAIGRPLCDYAAPVWSTSASAASWRKLQVAQNSALRVALGCHQAASEDHLHSEANMLKVEEHCSLLSRQFLATCFSQDHPCAELSLGHTGPLRRRGTYPSLLLTHHEWVAARLMWDPGGDQLNVRGSLNNIHTDHVAAILPGRSVNRVLGRQPPRIHPCERRLSREGRCLLSQLRSGHCIHLRSYQHRIRPNIADVCPLCGVASHTTGHIFNCMAMRTQLDVTSLWARPLSALRFTRYLKNYRMA